MIKKNSRAADKSAADRGLVIPVLR